MTRAPLNTTDRANVRGIGTDAGEAHTMTTRDRIELALRELGHIQRLQILELAHEAPISPKDAAAHTGASLGTIAYHTRELHADGLLRKHHEQRVRGAIQHFYVTSAAGRRLHARLLEEVPGA